MMADIQIHIDLDSIDHDSIFESIERSPSGSATEAVVSMDGQRLRLTATKPAHLFALAQKLNTLGAKLMAEEFKAR